MREEFEQAIAIEAGQSLVAIQLSRKDDSYSTSPLMYAWWAWQKARTDLAIELIAENEQLTHVSGCHLLRAQTLEVERDQLRAEVAGLKTGFEAYEQTVKELRAEVEALRKLVPSKEVIWCACGDGYAVNSYGAGFMEANNGVCANCEGERS